MKYIIGFVLLGVVTYAGAFFLITGLNEAFKSASEPSSFNAVTDPSHFTPGAVKGTINQTVGKLNKGVVTERDFFGVTFGKHITEYYYVIPAGDVKADLSDQQYMLLRVSGEEKTALLDKITFAFPKQESELSDSPKLEFVGYVSEMDDEAFSEMQTFLQNNEKLIGIGTWDMPQNKYFVDHICRYTVIVRPSENDSRPPIIIGTVLSTAGIGGIMLLIIKKVRENSGY